MKIEKISPGLYRVILSSGRIYNVIVNFYPEKNYYRAFYGPYSSTSEVSAENAVEKVGNQLERG